MRKQDKIKNIESLNIRLLSEGIPHIPEDKGPYIKKAIDQSLESGDLKRLKNIYKGLPNGWDDNYLINQLIQWINN